MTGVQTCALPISFLLVLVWRWSDVPAVGASNRPWEPAIGSSETPRASAIEALWFVREPAIGSAPEDVQQGLIFKTFPAIGCVDTSKVVSSLWGSSAIGREIILSNRPLYYQKVTLSWRFLAIFTELLDLERSRAIVYQQRAASTRVGSIPSGHVSSMLERNETRREKRHLQHFFSRGWMQFILLPRRVSTLYI